VAAEQGSISLQETRLLGPVFRQIEQQERFLAEQRAQQEAEQLAYQEFLDRYGTEEDWYKSPSRFLDGKP
jgi:hypothetical protein